jgi:hypothetical protein
LRLSLVGHLLFRLLRLSLMSLLLLRLLLLWLCMLCRLLVRLRGRPRRLLWLTLLLFRLLFFRLVLRVRRDNGPEKQNEGGSACCSKELHSDRLHSGRS